MTVYLTKRIILEADQYMTEKGILIVEVGNSQYALMEMCPDIPFTWLSFADGGDGVFLKRNYKVLEAYKRILTHKIFVLNIICSV